MNTFPRLIAGLAIAVLSGFAGHKLAFAPMPSASVETDALVRVSFEKAAPRIIKPLHLNDAADMVFAPDQKSKKKSPPNRPVPNSIGEPVNG
jgi:hypothetical protein